MGNSIVMDNSSEKIDPEIEIALLASELEEIILTTCAHVLNINPDADQGIIVRVMNRIFEQRGVFSRDVSLRALTQALQNLGKPSYALESIIATIYSHDGKENSPGFAAYVLQENFNIVAPQLYAVLCHTREPADEVGAALEIVERHASEATVLINADIETTTYMPRVSFSDAPQPAEPVTSMAADEQTSTDEELHASTQQSQTRPTFFDRLKGLFRKRNR